MRSSVAAIAVIVAMAGSAEATQENIYAVAQPVDSDGTGPTISDVTFVTWSDTLHEPSLLICLTAAESRVGSPYGFENRNMANRAGIRITAVRAAGSVGGYPGLFGDTLRVVLDVSAATAALSADGSPVLNLTVDAMLRNAARARRHAIRYLTIEVVGDSLATKCGGTYRIPEMPSN